MKTIPYTKYTSNLLATCVETFEDIICKQVIQPATVDMNEGSSPKISIQFLYILCWNWCWILYQSHFTFNITMAHVTITKLIVKKMPAEVIVINNYIDSCNILMI